MFVALVVLAFAALAVAFVLSQWNRRSTETEASGLEINPPAALVAKLPQTPKTHSMPVDQRLKVGADYQLDELYVSKDDGSIIGLNFSRRQLLLGTLQRPLCHHFKDIAGAELQRNGATLTQTNRGSQLAGAAIGGAAFGGVGALAGALTGSSRSTDRISTLQIAVTVDDRAIPLHKVTFIRSRRAKGLDPANADVARIMAVAETYFAHLTLAMREAAKTRDDPARPEDTPVLAEDAQLAAAAHQVHAINVHDWGSVKAPHLWLALQQARPELSVQEAALQGLPLYKRAPVTLWAASAGEARRLRSALTAAGASVSDE